MGKFHPKSIGITVDTIYADNACMERERVKFILIHTPQVIRAPRDLEQATQQGADQCSQTMLSAHACRDHDIGSDQTGQLVQQQPTHSSRGASQTPRLSMLIRAPTPARLSSRIGRVCNNNAVLVLHSPGNLLAPWGLQGA